jgi:hypothetical protein
MKYILAQLDEAPGVVTIERSRFDVLEAGNGDVATDLPAVLDADARNRNSGSRR